MKQGPFLVSLSLALLVHAGLLALWSAQGPSPSTPGTSLALSLSANRAPAKQAASAGGEPLPRPQPAPATEQPAEKTEKQEPPSTPADPGEVAGATGKPPTAAPDTSSMATGSTPARPTEGDADRYLDQVRRIISEQQRYPEEAGRRGIEGRVKIRFVIGPGGRVVEVAIAESSGSRLLDRATERMFAGLIFPPLPVNLGDRLALSVPVNWELN